MWLCYTYTLLISKVHNIFKGYTSQVMTVCWQKHDHQYRHHLCDLQFVNRLTADCRKTSGHRLEMGTGSRHFKSEGKGELMIDVSNHVIWIQQWLRGKENGETKGRGWYEPREDSLDLASEEYFNCQSRSSSDLKQIRVHTETINRCGLGFVQHTTLPRSLEIQV